MFSYWRIFCGCYQENGRAAPDLTASPGRAPPGPPQPPRANHAPPCVLQPDFRKVTDTNLKVNKKVFLLVQAYYLCDIYIC